MNPQLNANRRSQRPRPYDLRRRVLLKNFLREQMSYMPSPIINESDDHVESNNSELENEQNSENIDNRNKDEEKSLKEESDLLNAPSAIVSFSDCTVDSKKIEETKELSGNYIKIANEKPDSTQCGSAAELDVSDIGNESSNNTFLETDNCPNSREATDEKPKCGPEIRLRRKFSVKMPYSFSKRKNLRDTTKTQDSISKAKRHLKCPKSPQKRKSSLRVKFSNFFSPQASEKVKPLASNVTPKSTKTKKSDSFVYKLFKTKVCSSPSKKNSDCCGESSNSQSVSHCHTTIDINKEKVPVSSRSVSVQTEISGSCENLTNEDCNATQVLREENKKLVRKLNYLMSVNKKDYWLRSSDENRDSKLPSQLPCNTNQYRDENIDYTRFSPSARKGNFYEPRDRESSQFVSEGNYQNGSRLIRSKSIQEHTNRRHNEGKFVRCRRVKSVYVPSRQDFNKNYAFMTFRAPLMKVKDQIESNATNSGTLPLETNQHSSQGGMQISKASSSIYRSWSMNEQSPIFKHGFRSCRRTRSVHAPRDNGVSYRNMPAYKFS